MQREEKADLQENHRSSLGGAYVMHEASQHHRLHISTNVSEAIFFYKHYHTHNQLQIVKAEAPTQPNRCNCIMNEHSMLAIALVPGCVTVRDQNAPVHEVCCSKLKGHLSCTH
eukprot:1981218-Amphidinium_carterae.1